MEALLLEMRAIGLAVDDPMLYTCFLDTLPAEYQVEVRLLAGKTGLGREIMRTMRERFTHVPKSQEGRAPDHALLGGNAGGHAGRGERNGKHGAGGGRGRGRSGKVCGSNIRKDDDSTIASGEENWVSTHWKKPKCWRCGKKGHFRSECEREALRRMRRSRARG